MTTILSHGAEAPRSIITFNPNDRRAFIGGSDARIIMGDDQEDLFRLWREKRGEIAPQDFAQNLIVQLGTVTEGLNRTWYQRCTGQAGRAQKAHARGRQGSDRPWRSRQAREIRCYQL